MRGAIGTVAQSGAGNLRCAVANLLNLNGPLSSLVLLLNLIWLLTSDH